MKTACFTPYSYRNEVFRRQGSRGKGDGVRGLVHERGVHRGLRRASLRQLCKHPERVSCVSTRTTPRNVRASTHPSVPAHIDDCRHQTSGLSCPPDVRCQYDNVMNFKLERYNSRGLIKADFARSVFHDVIYVYLVSK